MIHNTKQIWGCQATSLPLNYLGILLRGNLNSTVFWDLIIEKIENKFSSWKFSYLSKEGKLTLTQAVLSNLPTCFLSIFKAPMNVCKSIEKKMREILFGRVLKSLEELTLLDEILSLGRKRKEAWVLIKLKLLMKSFLPNGFGGILWKHTVYERMLLKPIILGL